MQEVVGGELQQVAVVVEVGGGLGCGRGRECVSEEARARQLELKIEGLYWWRCNILTGLQSGAGFEKRGTGGKLLGTGVEQACMQGLERHV